MGRDPAAHRGELQPRHSPSSPPLRAGLLLPRRRLHLPPLDRLQDPEQIQGTQSEPGNIYGAKCGKNAY